MLFLRQSVVSSRGKHLGKVTLSIFIASLSVRTPVARARAINVHKAMYLRKLQRIARHESFVDVVMNKLKLVTTERQEEREALGVRLT